MDPASGSGAAGGGGFGAPRSPGANGDDAELDALLRTIDPRLCVACKGGRMLCGIDPCPLLRRIAHHMPKVAFKGRDLFGSSPPSLFVGRHGYPQVAVGPMLPPEHREADQARLLDAPREWMGLTIPDIVGMRSSLVRTTHKVRVDSPMRPDRILSLSQELAVAARPVDAEVRLSREIRFGGAPSVAEFTAPHGPTVGVERAVLAENVRVEGPVEKATSDTDLRAGAALWEMYRSGTDLYQLERILSAGMVGLERKRRLVPTRWSITATDDQVGKALIPRVMDLPTLDKPTVHFGERFGNRFFVLLLPRVWGFDLTEAWLKGNFWSRDAAAIVEEDWEDHTGRTTYATTAGGYYATRLSVLEHLVESGRQATAVVLREITDAYTTPLGVWVVRETCKAALATRPLVFEDVPSALRHVDRHALLKDWQRSAELLRQTRAQRSLDSY
ncbi:MAG TPA: Nre family DNA repair protein [Candidatus Thermoplasmatota archaeon]|nr:Nre family DNA repair protein [Candidatus Thermoplasmatota archaeon]